MGRSPPPPTMLCALRPATLKGCLPDWSELQTAGKRQKLGELRLEKAVGPPGGPSLGEHTLGLSPGLPWAS